MVDTYIYPMEGYFPGVVPSGQDSCLANDEFTLYDHHRMQAIGENIKYYTENAFLTDHSQSILLNTGEIDTKPLVGSCTDYHNHYSPITFDEHTIYDQEMLNDIDALIQEEFVSDCSSVNEGDVKHPVLNTVPQNTPGDNDSSSDTDETAIDDSCQSNDSCQSSDCSMKLGVGEDSDWAPSELSDTDSGCDVKKSKKNIKNKKIRKRNCKLPTLWQFLLLSLQDEKCCPALIDWVDKQKGIFVFRKSQQMAKLWGNAKRKENMKYEHLSRALRHYYARDILYRIKSHRLMYQFGPYATGWKRIAGLL